VPSRNEPFGIVVLEAWSAGKPVLATDNGGPAEFVKHEFNGLRIHPSPDSIAWGVNQIFGNFDRARWMGQNGKNALHASFTWERIAAQTARVYRRLRKPAEMPAAELRPGLRKIISRKSEPHVPADEGSLDGAKPLIKLDARVSIPARAGDGLADGILAALRARLTEHGFDLQERDHSLRIRGRWDEVTTALYECRASVTPQPPRTDFDPTD
jgi:hypothetical protein